MSDITEQEHLEIKSLLAENWQCPYKDLLVRILKHDPKKVEDGCKNQDLLRKLYEQCQCKNNVNLSGT